MSHDRPQEFRFEISGNLADFAALVAILRGDTIDMKQIAQMSRDLRQASEALQAEIDQQRPSTP